MGRPAFIAPFRDKMSAGPLSWPLCFVLIAATIPYPLSRREPPPSAPEQITVAALENEKATFEERASLGQQAKLEDQASLQQQAKFEEQVKLEQQAKEEEESLPGPPPPTPNLSYLAYYAYSEVPPDIKPADTIAAALKEIPVGTPAEEIRRASDALGLDFTFMKTVARIESGFDPKQRTGSYIGLFQLSHYEFDKYGSGEIIGIRDNAIAAAYKFTTAAILFELESHQKPTLYDLYLIHQQGTQGAAEHVAHPERVAWKSMCATDEGRQKGEKWCKRAIWQNTLPAIKTVWKSVDNLTSGAFVDMWRERVDHFYARYSATASAN
jgi:hypothetical protein